MMERIKLEVEDIEENGDKIFNVLNVKGQKLGMFYKSKRVGGRYAFWDLDGECWFMPDCLREIANKLQSLNKDGEDK